MFPKDDNNAKCDTIEKTDIKQEVKQYSLVENVNKQLPKKRVMFFTLSEDTFITSAPELRSDKNSAKTSLWGNPILGTYSIIVTCPNCRHSVNTEVDYQNSWRSYAANAATGLCCLPLFYKYFQTGTHHCPLCLVYLGHLGPPVCCVVNSRINSNETSACKMTRRRTPNETRTETATTINETLTQGRTPYETRTETVIRGTYDIMPQQTRIGEKEMNATESEECPNV